MTTTVVTTHVQQIDAFGGPGALRSGIRDMPPLERGQVQIKVAATTVNPIDLMARAGNAARNARFPMILGWDVAGTIEQIGDGVEGWKAGDRVAAMTVQPLDQNGTYTERMNLSADLLARVPDYLEFDRAATIPLAGLTARQLLGWVDLAAGATLLVVGASGAIGRFVVQLASGAGIRVTAVAKREDREDAFALGASEIVDRGDFAAEVRALHPSGVDAAIDVVGGEAMRSALASVRDGGACVTAFHDFKDSANKLRPERGIRVENLGVHPDATGLTRLLDAAGRGELSTSIAVTYALAEAAQAHERMERGGLRGKIVLRP